MEAEQWSVFSAVGAMIVAAVAAAVAIWQARIARAARGEAKRSADAAEQANKLMIQHRREDQEASRPRLAVTFIDRRELAPESGMEGFIVGSVRNPSTCSVHFECLLVRTSSGSVSYGHLDAEYGIPEPRLMKPGDQFSWRLTAEEIGRAIYKTSDKSVLIKGHVITSHVVASSYSLDVLRELGRDELVWFSDPVQFDPWPFIQARFPSWQM